MGGIKVGKGEKRVILIPGDKSAWFDQAIFIIRPKATNIPIDFVAAAEAIVSQYLETGEHASAREYALTSQAVATHVSQISAPIPLDQDFVEITTRPSGGRAAKKFAKKSGKKKGKAGVDVALYVIMLVCCIALAGLLTILIAF